jgi:glycosyltransferase involved in cell wall biosynthesis
MIVVSLESTSEVSAQTRHKPWVSTVIPALNEEEPIAGVVRTIPRDTTDEIIVVDNGSTDRTAERARAEGAHVVHEPRRGYGRACRAGVQAASPQSEVLVFLDGDGSDPPELMPRLLAPIAAGTHDFVIGSRTRGQREVGSMNLSQLLAGRAAGLILRALYGVSFTDMCPFRAIRRDALEKLGMREETYGWNLEMQIRAARAGLRILEVPVNHRRRTGGKSKVSGTVSGTIRGGARILFTLFRVTCTGKSG